MHIYSTSLEMVKLARNWNQRASSASQRSHEETVTACDWLNWTSSDSLHVKYFSARENKSLMYSKQSPQRSASGRHLGATWSGFGDDTICHHQVCEALAAWHELWVELYRPHWHSHTRSQQHTHTHTEPSSWPQHSVLGSHSALYPSWIITGFRLFALIEI